MSQWSADVVVPDLPPVERGVFGGDELRRTVRQWAERWGLPRWRVASVLRQLTAEWEARR